jgi:RNA polymerase sigma factor (sigma-70 family)
VFDHALRRGQPDAVVVLLTLMVTNPTAEQVAALVRRHFDGDEQALNDLTAIFHSLVRAAARRVLTCPSDVDDAVQDTWISFVRFGHRIADPSRVGAWLWTVALNSARRIQRRQGRCIAADNIIALVDALADERPDPDLGLQRCERAAAVHRAAADMRESDRRVLSLLMDERAYDYRQISTMSGRPIGSLGPTRDRIIRKLRANPQVAELMEAV